MPEAPKHDPNVPNPAEPWCPQCESHSKYTVSQVYTGNDGTFRDKYNCKACGEAKFVHEMFIPCRTEDNVSFATMIGIKFPAICMFGIPLLFYFIGPDTEKSRSEFPQFAGAMSVFFLIWILLGWYTLRVTILRRKKWLAWVRERGFTGD